MTKVQGIWGASIAAALTVLYVLYAIIFYPSAFFQTNAVVGTYQCGSMLNETNITVIESFLRDVNTTIKQGKASDVVLSASLPVKTDPNDGPGNTLEECSKMVTSHLNDLKNQKYYQ